MRRILILGVLSLTVVNVFAQEVNTTLTFNEAVKIGLKNNVTLNQQKNTLFTRQVQKSQGIANFLPSVAINGEARRTDGLQPTADYKDLRDSQIDEVNASIRAELTIFNGFNNINRLNQNVNLFKAQSSLVERTKQDVIFDVTNQYLQVLLDQELLNIAEESFRTQNVVLDQLRAQVQVGSRAEAELYTQEAQVKNMELLALRSKVTLENDKATLAQTLQLDPAIPFDVEYPEGNTVEFTDDVNLDSLYAQALTLRQDLHQADYQIEANKSSYRASINGYMPRVNLFAQYGSYYNSSMRDQPLYGEFNNQFIDVWPSTVYGVSVSIPIFDRLQTRSTRVINRMEYENAKLQRDNLVKAIKIDVKRSYNNYLTAKQAFDASMAQYQAGELALQTQQESFILGVSNQVTLAQANQTYVEAASSRAQARVTLVFQKILLEYALGSLNTEDIQ